VTHDVIRRERRLRHRFSVELKGEEVEITLEPLEGGKWKITRGGTSRVLDVRKLSNGNRSSSWSIVADGGGPATLVDVDGTAPELTVTLNNVSVPLKVASARSKLAAAAATRPRDTGPTAVRSPMPGKVVKVLVKVGDEVKAGQGVVVVEAMKMENELKAPRDGKIKQVTAEEGRAVESGQTLALIE
jgi:biotin carboxyl carrier protein